MNAQPPSHARVLDKATETILGSLPQQWSGRTDSRIVSRGGRADLVIEITDPAGDRQMFIVKAKRSLEPREVRAVAEDARSVAESIGGAPVVAAGYLSPRTRALLEEENVGYVDTTRNVRIMSESPGLFILTTGAQRDPWPRTDGLQSLRGRGSSRAVRALVDFTPPFGIRELAERSGASSASLSRVAGLLEREALISRQGRGPITDVDWQGVIRRWSQDYDQIRSNTAYRFLAPRGLSDLRKRLKDGNLAVAATGAFASQEFDPVAPAQTAAVYAADPPATAKALELRDADSGANVVLLEPYDPVVFDRTVCRNGLTTVAPSQLAVDLLTGPGREPSQGEVILEWMKGHEDVWRT